MYFLLFWCIIRTFFLISGPLFLSFSLILELLERSRRSRDLRGPLFSKMGAPPRREHDFRNLYEQEREASYWGSVCFRLGWRESWGESQRRRDEKPNNKITTRYLILSYTRTWRHDSKRAWRLESPRAWIHESMRVRDHEGSRARKHESITSWDGLTCALRALVGRDEGDAFWLWPMIHRYLQQNLQTDNSMRAREHETMRAWELEIMNTWDLETIGAQTHESARPWDHESRRAWRHEGTGVWEQESMIIS